MSTNYSPTIVTDGAVFVGDALMPSISEPGTRLYNRAGVNSADVKLLIHGNVGSGQSFTDSSLSNHTITAGGDVTHSTTQSKFSGSSIYFDGTDYLTIPDSADWSNGANDFTWDCWIYPTSMNLHAGIIHQGETGANQECNTLNTYNTGTGNIRWLIRNAGGTLLDISTASSSVPPNKWYHVAAVRSGSYFTIYINGVAGVTSSAIATAIDDLSWPLFIGKRDVNSGATEYWYAGYMDEIRITKGVALWTQDFTPPARRDTLSISDGMMYNGTCISLDGGDEYVNCGDASDLTVTTGSFTLIGYIRNNTIGGYDVVVQKGNAGHGTNPGYRLRWENDNTLDFICTQSSSYAEATLQSLGALSQDVWYQVAVTRNAGLLSVYIDGVLNNSLASAITGTLTTSENFIIGRNNYGSGSGYFDGQMADWKFFNVALSADQVKELYDNSKLIIPSGVSQSNLKLWLPLSEGIGTICYDGSGNGNHGTFTNADSSGDWLTGQTGCPQLVEGYNRPMLFDGNLSAGDHVDCGASNALITGTTLSISAWVKSDNTTKSRVFQAQKGAGSSSYSLAMNNNGGSAAAGYVSFLTYPGSSSHNYLNYDASLDDGAWHHLACSTTASAQKLYVDGALVASASATFSNTTSADIANIGSVGGASEFASGLINEVVLYDSELSLAQVQALAATGPNGGPLPPDPMSLSNSSDVVAYWRNDGNVTWTDRAGSANGTVSGSPSALLFKQGINGSASTSTGRDGQGFPLKFKNVGAVGYKGSNYISVPHSSVFDNTAFSFCSWVYVPGDTTADGKIGHLSRNSSGNGWAVWQLRTVNGATNEVKYQTNNGGTWQTQTYSNFFSGAGWYYVCVTHIQGNAAKLYRNGIEVSGSGSCTQDFDFGIDPLYIGARKNGSTMIEFWDGQIANSQYYNRILSYAEIQQNYKAQRSRFE